jgi:hypothetical protein
MTAIASSGQAALDVQATVKNVTPVIAGTQDIPPGTSGTVVAVLGAGSTYEISFGPPASTTETVPQNLLAVV